MLEVQGGLSASLRAQCLWCECLLLACRLLPSMGTIEEYAAQSCKDVRDTRSNDCQLPPLSGPYYINTTDTCTGNNRTLKVYARMLRTYHQWEVGSEIKHYLLLSDISQWESMQLLCMLKTAVQLCRCCDNEQKVLLNTACHGTRASWVS